MSSGSDFEQVAALYYEPLYRFAWSLTRNESDAADLTQDTFRIWATKGHQLQDVSKVKAWLFTTLHRQFLQGQRRRTRFPDVELSEAADDLPQVDPDTISQLDAQKVLDCLARIDAHFQAPVALFYLEDYSYPEIAKILEIPLGTVKSRIARGLSQLKAQFVRKPLTTPVQKPS